MAQWHYTTFKDVTYEVYIRFLTISRFYGIFKLLVISYQSIPCSLVVFPNYEVLHLNVFGELTSSFHQLVLGCSTYVVGFLLFPSIVRISLCANSIISISRIPSPYPYVATSNYGYVLSSPVFSTLQYSEWRGSHTRASVQEISQGRSDEYRG